MVLTRLTKRSTNSSKIGRWTRKRLREQQSWPALSYTDHSDDSTQASRFASAKIMFADLPPSSSDTRLMPSAASFSTLAPTSVEPVIEILRTSGCETSADPARLPGPGNTLNTPSGTPACSNNSPNASAVSGVTLAGFNTTVLPIASAGAIFHAAIMSGKFHGVINTHTPKGSWNVIRFPSLATGIVSPWNLLTAPA